MKKNVVRILTAMLMLSVVFSSSVFAAEKQPSAWDSFVGLFTGSAAAAEEGQVDGITYQTQIQNEGWAQGWVSDGAMSGSEGKGLRLEGIEIKIDNEKLPADLGVTYITQIENLGWDQGWVSDGELSGTVGQWLRLEGIKIMLTGDSAADYSVRYKTHIQNIGWEDGWKYDGEMSGTEGQALRLEGIKIEVVKKVADLTAYDAALAAVTESDYTAESWAAYQAVVDANVVTSDNLQSEVDAATAAITAAQADLVKVLKVESVTVLNLGQIEVKFNTAVTKDTAEDLTNNYALDAKVGTDNADLTDAVATLQADEKTVLIDLDTAKAAVNQETRKLTIKDVMTADDQKLAEVSFDLSFFDTTLPIAQSVVQTGTKTLKVTFSEPVKAGGTYKINNGTYSAPAVVTTAGPADRNIVTLTLGTVLPDGNYTLTVEGVPDLAGFKNVSTDLSFVYGSDTTAPTVALKEVESDAKTVVLEFSKDMDSTTLVNNANVVFSHTYKTHHEVTGSAVTKVAANQYKVLFADALPPGTSSIFIDYKAGITDANKAKDLYGNILALPVTLEATVVADTTAPTVVSAEATTAKKIEVVFSKDVDATDAQTASNFILRDSDNKAVSLSTLAYVSADKKTTITTTADMDAGNYTLEIKNIKDKAVVPNTLVTVTKTIAVADKVAPKVDAVIYDGTDNKLIVKFDKDMSATGLTTLTNYVLKVNLAQTDFPTGTVASIKDAKTVEIALGATVADLDGTDDKLDISGTFTDTLGNAIGGLSVTKDIEAATSVAPEYVADSAKVTEKDTVTFEVNTELQAIDKSKIKFATEAVDDATYVNQGNKAFVTIEIHTPLTNTAAAGWAGDDKLVLEANALTSSFGGVNAEIKLAGSAIADKVAPFIKSVETGDADTNGQIDKLTVVFSESVVGGTVQASDFSISDDYTVNSVLSVTGDTAVIKLNESGAPDTGATPTAAVDGSIEDLVGNITTTTDVVTSTDKAAPVLTYKSISTGATPTIVFDASEKLAAHAAVVGAIPAADKSLVTLPTEGGTAWTTSMDGTTTVGISIIAANDTTVTMTVGVAGTTAVGSTVSGSTLGTEGTGAIADLAANPAATNLLGTATAQ